MYVYILYVRMHYVCIIIVHRNFAIINKHNCCNAIIKYTERMRVFNGTEAVCTNGSRYKFRDLMCEKCWPLRNYV